VPSYRLLIIASALAYYFLAGVGAFGMIFFRRHYGVAHGEAVALIVVLGLGALVGVAGGGRLSTWLLKRGSLNARITLPAVALFASAPPLAFGILTTSVWLAVVLLTLGAAVLAAAVAPIDAARLDIVHPRLWGRAESGRMALRSALEGSAPLLFGAMSGWLGGGGQGLAWTFLIMLAPLIAACFVVIPGRRTYPRDVATAAASVDAIARRGGGGEGRAGDAR